MKRTFILAASALIVIDLLFTRRWERIIRHRAKLLDESAEHLASSWESHREADARLVERESILPALFEALADARSALLATVENLSRDDEDEEAG